MAQILGVGVAPWVRSGYGGQISKYFRFLAREGHDVMLYAYRGLIGTTITWPPTPEDEQIYVMPQGRQTKFGLEILPHYHKLHNADVVISLSNLVIFTEIKDYIAQSAWPWYHWMPVDCDPLGAPDYNLMNATGIKPIAITKFGKRVLADAGWETAIYMPHAINCNTYYPPATLDRIAARKHLGIKDDVFVIGMNAANEDGFDRKAFFPQLTAFSRFHERHPKSFMYIHTIPNRYPVGLDIPSMLTRLGINDSVIFSDSHLYNAGAYSDEMLRDMFYWTADIGTNCSQAEGFGLPVVEFQACGVPVVVTNNSAMTETTAKGEYGAMRIPCQPSWSNLDSSRWGMPMIDSIEDAYELYHLAWRNGDMELYRREARLHALDYDVMHVEKEYWRPATSRILREATGHGTIQIEGSEGTAAPGGPETTPGT